eukprot:359793-Chlamydomonas_euryale.AAC.25
MALAPIRNAGDSMHGLFMWHAGLHSGQYTQAMHQGLVDLVPAIREDNGKWTEDASDPGGLRRK